MGSKLAEFYRGSSDEKGGQRSPPSWSVERLGNMGQWLSGGTPNTEEVCYWNGSIPWITASALKSPYLRTSERRLTPDGVKAGSRLVPAGTILFVVRSMSLKTEFRVGMATCEMAFGQDCKAIIPNPEIDGKFLLYALLSRRDEILSMVDEASHGTGRLQTAAIQALELGLPPLHEQRAIAHILGTLDDKIELNRRMNETLEGMARAIFNSWFVDFDPVRAKLEGHQPAGMDPETAALFPDSFEDSPLGKIPKGWATTNLPDAFEVNPLRSLPKGSVALYLEMGNMPTSSARALTWENREFTSGMKFVNGDVLVARITPCLENGKTAFVDFLAEGQVGWGSTEYIVLHSKPPLPPEYAYFLARSDDFRSHAIQNMTGTSGRQRVPAECFDSYQVTVPLRQIAEIFGVTASSVMKAMKQHDEESHTLAAIRDALLPKLLSGEVRVKDADKFMEKAVNP